MNFAIVLATFVVIFPAELPDKTMIAAMVLGSKYKARHVFAGVALAFAAQVAIAVTAGHFLSLLPHRLLQLVVGLLFAAGAILIFKERGGNAKLEKEMRPIADAPPFWKVSAMAFAVVFLAEFGDLTQIATANLAAKFNDPLSVGVGSVLALWAVGAISIWGGKNFPRVIAIRIFTGIAALVLAILAVISIVAAFA